MLMAASCSSGQEVGLGQEFQLRPGGTAVIGGENLEIRFIKIVEDSRCPVGATCIWAGRAVCLVEVKQNGEVWEYSLIESGGSSQAEQLYAGYRFTFHVTPYPELEKEIQAGQYRLILKMTRAD